MLILCLVAVAFFSWFEIYLPPSLTPTPPISYIVAKGENYKQISFALANAGIIKSSGFFNIYVLLSGQESNIKAGGYQFSSSMSSAQILTKMVDGDVVKNNITIIEGWDLRDIANYVASKNLYSKKTFLEAANQNWSRQFNFLQDKPKAASLEGYLFPDTYQVALGDSPNVLIQDSLENFGNKLTPSLRAQITAEHKSIFQIVIMASILEKEVQTPADKKIVAGILWKRLAAGIPLDVDSTVNYVDSKNLTAKINSPYNTYAFAGLPPGPICNPGLDSIQAAIFPTKSPYWYYLSDPATQKTIFSKTLEEQNAAVAKYLR